MVFENFFGKKSNKQEAVVPRPEKKQLFDIAEEDEQEDLLMKEKRKILEEQADNILMESGVGKKDPLVRKLYTPDWIAKDPRFEAWLKEGDISNEATFPEDLMGENYSKDEQGDPLFWEEIYKEDIPFEERDLSLEWKKEKSDSDDEFFRKKNKVSAPIENKEYWKRFSPSTFHYMMNLVEFFEKKKKGLVSDSGRPTRLKGGENEFDQKISDQEIGRIYQTLKSFRKENPKEFSEMMVETGLWNKGEFKASEVDDSKIFFTTINNEQYFTKDNPKEFFHDGKGLNYFKVSKSFTHTPEHPEDGRVSFVVLQNKKQDFLKGQTKPKR